MMYSWCLVLAFYPCIAVVDEGSFSLGVNVLLSAGFIAGDGDELLLLLLLLHWMSISGLRARSRDAQAAVESDLFINYIYKEIIKARPIKLQNRSIYMLIIRSDSAFLLFSCQQPVYIWFNSKHTIQLMVWEVGTESPCVYENSRENAQRIKLAAERQR